MIAYCSCYQSSCYHEYSKVCQDFVEAVKEIRPEVMKKSKIHLLLHLTDNICEFGPTSAYNTERYEGMIFQILT